MGDAADDVYDAMMREQMEKERPSYNPAAHYHVPGDGSWWVKDARGIEIARVCDGCKSVKLAGYRRDIFTNALYQAEEPIDDE